MSTITRLSVQPTPGRGLDVSGPAGMPVIGNTLQFQRDPLGFLMRTAADYGDVARYRLGNIAFYQINHPDGVQRVLQDNHHNYVKGDLFDIIRRVAGDGLFTSEGALWQRQRRLMLPAFHRRRIAGFGEIMTGRTLDMLAQFDRLLRHVDDNGPDAIARASAQAIHDFFGASARQHHAEEEQFVFPPLLDSDAVIVNIDYPLGFAAYHLLTRLAVNIGELRGAYVIGKAATLNGRIGDVLVPNTIYDEHSQNTYLFSNVFKAADVSPYLVYGTVLDNQKAVSVMGTFLQNARFMDVFYREGYTDIEMESGSYLSAIYEMVRPRRHPVNEIASLYEAPFDIGILHYASDTPLSKGKNLGAGALSYFGMDSTYACTIAILRRILHLECKRMNS